jgi:hypothetical protein
LDYRSWKRLLIIESEREIIDDGTFIYTNSTNSILDDKPMSDDVRDDPMMIASILFTLPFIILCGVLIVLMIIT